MVASAYLAWSRVADREGTRDRCRGPSCEASASWWCVWRSCSSRSPAIDGVRRTNRCKPHAASGCGHGHCDKRRGRYAAAIGKKHRGKHAENTGILERKKAARALACRGRAIGEAAEVFNLHRDVQFGGIDACRAP